MTRLAEQLSFFQLRYFDGEQWLQDWPMELEEVPMLVEISLGAIVKEQNDRNELYTKQVFINFPRNGQEEEEMNLEMEVPDPQEAMNQT
jgi:hypothetical protein